MRPAITPGVDRAGALNSARAAGLVFGDIGTSPISTLTVIPALVPRTGATVPGVRSLIVWTLILIVTVQYDGEPAVQIVLRPAARHPHGL